MRDAAVIFLNGVRRDVRGRDALRMLAEWLRAEVGLPGTKIVCAEGDCGACTVLRSFRGSSFEVVNACITTVAQMDGSHLVTVEGLEEPGRYAPVQEAMQRCHGSQCGYCTPGFVMALAGMHERTARPTRKAVANALTGNLCRCTGYSQILDAGCAVDGGGAHALRERYLTPQLVEEAERAIEEPLELEAPPARFIAPTTLRGAMAVMATNPSCRIIGGATDLGVVVNKGGEWPATLVSLHLVSELGAVTVGRRRVTVGATATIEATRRACTTASPEFARFLNLFASPQIKSVATLAGNVANASPIGDTLPFLLVQGGVLHLAKRAEHGGAMSRRELPLSDAFVGYRRLALEPGELITHISFDRARERESLRLYKVSMRKDLDISAVSAAFWVTHADEPAARRRAASTSERYPVIAAARVAYGGVAATPVRLLEVESTLCGELTPAKVDTVAALIQAAIQPISDPRASAAYRRVVATNIFRRFADEVCRG